MLGQVVMADPFTFRKIDFFIFSIRYMMIKTSKQKAHTEKAKTLALKFLQIFSG